MPIARLNPLALAVPVLVGVVAAGCAAIAGEDDDAPSCSHPEHSWQASYEELSGTCGAFEGPETAS